MKNILILHTGGTISMVQDSDGVVAPVLKNPLSDINNVFKKDINLIAENIFNLPSPHITLKEMLLLKRRIEQAQNEGIDGIVITHGTDTLEETAYFLDITLKKKIPVVLTGAMRSSNEIGSDGLYNFYNAILTASDDKAKNQCVLVVLNDEIHAAQFVTKTHTTNVDTFRTPTFGPVGIVLKHEVYFMKEVVTKRVLDIKNIEDNVFLIKAYANMDGRIFDLIENANISGLVIEALGAGNMPPSCINSIQSIIDKDIPIALVSRCSNGIAQDIYDYQGGGVMLKKMGVMFVKGINGPKARIRLVVGLNNNLDKHELREFMIE